MNDPTWKADAFGHLGANIGIYWQQETYHKWMDVEGMGDWFILRIVNGRYKLRYFCGVPKSTDKKGYHMKLRATWPPVANEGDYLCDQSHFIPRSHRYIFWVNHWAIDNTYNWPFNPLGYFTNFTKPFYIRKFCMRIEWVPPVLIRQPVSLCLGATTGMSITPRYPVGKCEIRKNTSLVIWTHITGT